MIRPDKFYKNNQECLEKSGEREINFTWGIWGKFYGKHGILAKMGARCAIPGTWYSAWARVWVYRVCLTSLK